MSLFGSITFPTEKIARSAREQFRKNKYRIGPLVGTQKRSFTVRKENEAQERRIRRLGQNLGGTLGQGFR